MAVTVMKTSSRKLSPKNIKYRDYRYFSNDRFRKSLVQGLSSIDIPFESFWSTYNNVLDRAAPRKKKYVRGNHSPFMNKTLSKAIMLRTKMRNIFLKNRPEENKDNYRKQRNKILLPFRCF